jgi:hypothetical protein
VELIIRLWRARRLAFAVRRLAFALRRLAFVLRRLAFVRPLGWSRRCVAQGQRTPPVQASTACCRTSPDGSI